MFAFGLMYVRVGLSHRWANPGLLVMPDIPDQLLYEGVTVDIEFESPGPTFGDLFLICGDSNPRFSPSGKYAFETLRDLQFTQVDDYFGVQSLSVDGDDVVVWLFPLVDGEAVNHHPGPFNGIRLQYNVLRNPSRHISHFLRCVSEFAAMSSRPSPNLAGINQDIDAIVEYWRSNGIEVGSKAALLIDF